MNTLQAQTAYIGSTEIKQVRLGDELVLAPNGDALWYKANELPSLDLRFAENKSLVDATTGANLVDFTRASSGTYVDSEGVIQIASTDEPRFDHNPTTGESLGLLVEEQRTNSITNNTMVGAVAGTPGTNPTGWFLTGSANGISPEIVGTGVEDGITYVDIRYSGTSTNSGNFSILASTVTAITAATGQSWTGSAYVKLQAGSLSNLTNTLQSVNGRSSIGAGLESTNSTYTPTSDSLGVQRRTVSITLANASTARISHTIFNAAYASGATIDITLRIGLPQLEQGAFATSVIPTTTAAATRAADVASISGSNFSSWYRQDEGTTFAAYSQYASGGNIYTISDGTAANFITIQTNSIVKKAASANVFVASSNIGRIDSVNALTANLLAKAAYGLSNGSRSLVTLGETAVTAANPATMPVVNRLFLGSNNNGTSLFANGHIRRLTYWPARLPNSTLQTITQ